MKKKKQKVSLTAKERKVQRRGLTEAEKEQERIRQEELAANKRKKRKLFITITAIVLVGIIALGAIAGGIYLIVNSNKVDNNKVNPLATITLSNGKKIEIELLYKESITESSSGTVTNGRGSIANLIYLAESKYYDNTMFTNIDRGFLSMEGYTDPTTSKAKNEDFVATLKGFKSDHHNEWGKTLGDNTFKLGYRITTRTVIKPETINNIKQRAGYLAMISGSATWGGSTGYMLLHDNSPNLKIDSINLESSNMTYMGKMDADSIAVLKEIAAMEKTDNTIVNGWKYATDYQSVMISSVRITRLNKDLKKRIMNDFEDYVLDVNSDAEDAIKANGSDIWRKTTYGTT